MNKSLILVESPTKARTLDRFLNGKYDIEASMGHIRDLPRGEFGIDTEDNFAIKYVIPADKRKVVESLKERVRDIDRIILATDPDREGEAIAHHLYEILKDETQHNTQFQRIVFHEITPSAIDDALLHPRDIDEHLVSAQTARRVLDRIVGYKLSPLLWKKIKRNLSGGRVQSVVLRLIVEREREIEHFKSEKYYRVSVILRRLSGETIDPDSVGVEFVLIKINDRDIEESIKLDLYDGDYTYTKTNLSEKNAENIKKDLDGKNFEVIDASKKETKRSPYPPFITSSLTQEASRRFGFTSKKTMTIAQKLYEEGYITYHRTDSFNLSNNFIFPARKFIEKEFGKKYISDSPRMFKTKSKVAQEAHEAIRPTSVGQISNIKYQISRSDSQALQGRMAKMGRDYFKLYELIYKRAVATQMADAVFESTKISVEAKNGSTYLFEKNGSVLKFDGFLKLVGLTEAEDLVPDMKRGEKLLLKETNVSEHDTNPPPRYSEASLIGSLERHGIGRPSTYAPIISTVQSRYYIERKEGRFFPTEIGIAVNDFLVKEFPDIDDIPFTAEMEESLDEIANGEKEWIPMIRQFYGPFEKKVIEAEKGEKIEIPVEKTGKICPLCGSEVVVRFGRYGKFYACSRFPECKHTAPIVQETGQICPQDGGKIVVRRTRRGRTFFGCINYPACKFAVWKLEDLDKKLKAQNANRKTTSQNSKL